MYNIYTWASRSEDLSLCRDQFIMQNWTQSQKRVENIPHVSDLLTVEETLVMWWQSTRVFFRGRQRHHQTLNQISWRVVILPRWPSFNIDYDFQLFFGCTNDMFEGM